MQGGVLTPLKCSVQIDTLGKEILESTECSKTLYKYKGCVKIPPISFVDDCLTVTNCGPNSVKMNDYVQSKAETKKLELSETKCFKMHVGTDEYLCPQLEVHERIMKASEKEKYLGDVVTSDTKIDLNIKMRHDKGIGIINQIMSILKEVCFGFHYFQMGLLFRNSLLINGILFNTEVLHKLSNKHIEQLEECDKIFMRRLFETGTPVEAFFIETGALPLKFILMGRQLMYYHAVLRKSESELVKRVFLAQSKFPSKSDWVSQIKKTLTQCDINMTEDDISQCSKNQFKKIVDTKIRQKASEYLINLQMTHSKSKFLYHTEKIQEYLTSDEFSTTQKKLLFKMRVKMSQNKTNFKSMYKGDLSCILYKDKSTRESEIHLLNCSFLYKVPELSKQIQKLKCDECKKKSS